MRNIEKEKSGREIEKKKQEKIDKKLVEKFDTKDVQKKYFGLCICCYVYYV